MSQNCEELRAKQWLEEQGHTDICSQSPNDPPDFVAGKCIAVEVRRLNWMNDSNEGVESDEHALTKAIEKALEEAGEPPGGYGVVAKCQSHGAIPKTSKTKELVRQAFDQYAKKMNEALKSGERPKSWTMKWKEDGIRRTTEWNCGIRLRFSSTSILETCNFQVCVEAEAPSRGWSMSDAIDNINRCVQEKTDKIKNRIHLYPEWWLVLVDYNIYTPDRSDYAWQTIRNGLVDTTPWARIVVLNQSDSKMHVDLI